MSRRNRIIWLAEHIAALRQQLSSLEGELDRLLPVESEEQEEVTSETEALELLEKP